jgi:hypothetical protein
MLTRERDALARGPWGPHRVVQRPTAGERCPRCHSRIPPARCELCAPPPWHYCALRLLIGRMLRLYFPNW